MITNAGLAALASRELWDSTDHEAPFTYIALGTGTTEASATDTTLEAEIVDSGLERAIATLSRVTTTAANDTAQRSHEFTATGTKAITEVGVLNAASEGTLMARNIITTKNVDSGDTITITSKTVKTNV